MLLVIDIDIHSLNIGIDCIDISPGVSLVK